MMQQLREELETTQQLHEGHAEGSNGDRPFLFRFLEPAEAILTGTILDTLSPEDKPRPPEPTKPTPWGD